METQAIRAKFKKSEHDTGSVAMQVILLTEKITHLTEHCKVNPKDHSSKRGMVKMVAQRRKSLTYLNRKHPDQYASLIDQLHIRK
ncbi:MAG: 30S ribosomal protein S15 [Candidatus Babeliales bacterium]